MSRPGQFLRPWWDAWLEAIGGVNRRTMRSAYAEAFGGDETAPRGGPSDAKKGHDQEPE